MRKTIPDIQKIMTVMEAHPLPPLGGGQGMRSGHASCF